MQRRVPLILAVAVLGVAAVSTAALAGVQVGPGGPNAQVGVYTEPTGNEGNPPGRDVEPVGGGGAAPSADTGAGGQLPFTGFVLLPLVMAGSLLALGAVALRRRAGDSPVPA